MVDGWVLRQVLTGHFLTPTLTPLHHPQTGSALVALGPSGSTGAGLAHP